MVRLGCVPALARTRATSNITAVPEALSSAPGNKSPAWRPK